MNAARFSMMLSLLASQTIKEIASRHKMPELEAARLFYKSKVYRMLENEKTKFWHFSYMSLCMMYDEEKEKGSFAMPEET
ncbi:MAG: hypothetical protein LBI85_06550 [Spirochaetaceae bacterium]|jgi:hypothetical protein|nr:hypothetical protein [Spirochaetaceae bacterium]